MPVNEDGIEEPRQYALMSPSEIDELVTMDWSIQQPVLLEVEPWTYAVLGLLTVHAGGKGRLVMEGEEMVVPPDYRYHRYWMPDSLCKVESFHYDKEDIPIFSRIAPFPFDKSKPKP